MNYFFCIILMLLIFSCSLPKETLRQDNNVDLESLNSAQSDVDMALLGGPSEKKKSSVQERTPNEEQEPPQREAPPKVVLNAQTLPVSEPHSGSPGGSIADTLKVFQCENLNAEGQDNFFLHVLNYRIHQLGVHPLCEVIQVKNLQKEDTAKEILAYAHYQRSYCDAYTSQFIDELDQHQCVQIITLTPMSNASPGEPSV